MSANKAQNVDQGEEKFKAPNWSYTVFSRTRFDDQRDLMKLKFVCLTKDKNAQIENRKTIAGPWQKLWAFSAISNEPFKMEGTANWETIDPGKISGQLDPDGLIGNILKLFQGSSVEDPKAFQTGGFTQQRYKGSQAPSMTLNFRVYSDQDMFGLPPNNETSLADIWKTDPLEIAASIQRLAVPRHTVGRGDNQLTTQIKEIVEKFKSNPNQLQNVLQEMFGGLFNMIKPGTAAANAFESDSMKDPGNDILDVTFGDIFRGIFVMTNYSFTFSKEYLVTGMPLYIDFVIGVKGYMLAAKDEIISLTDATNSENKNKLSYPKEISFDTPPYIFTDTNAIKSNFKLVGIG